MIFRYINTNEVERLGHVVVSHPCKCGLGVPFDCSGFLTTNAPTERPQLLHGVRHLRGNGLFRRHLTLRSIEPRSTICKIQGDISLHFPFHSFTFSSLKRAWTSYGSPINRPAMATVHHIESETTATTLFQTGLMRVSSASATVRRTAKVKRRASGRAAIFTQKAVR